MVVQCVLVSHMGRMQMKKTFEISVPPRSHSDLRRLLQAEDVRLQQMPFSFTGSLPPYGAQVKFDTDHTVRDFFSKCHDAVTFDVVIEGNNVPNVQADLIDEDVVTLHVYPPDLNGGKNDISERMFFIPPANIAQAIARTVKLMIKDANSLPMNLVVLLIQNSQTKVLLSDEKKLKEVLQSHARQQTPVRLTYKWEPKSEQSPGATPTSSPVPSPQRNHPVMEKTPNTPGTTATVSPVPSPQRMQPCGASSSASPSTSLERSRPPCSSSEEQPCVKRPASRSRSTSNSKLFSTLQPEIQAPDRTKTTETHSADTTPRQPPENSCTGRKSPKSGTAPTTATSTPMAVKAGARPTPAPFSMKGPSALTSIPQLAPSHTLPRRGTCPIHPTPTGSTGSPSQRTPQDALRGPLPPVPPQQESPELSKEPTSCAEDQAPERAVASQGSSTLSPTPEPASVVKSDSKEVLGFSESRMLTTPLAHTPDEDHGSPSPRASAETATKLAASPQLSPAGDSVKREAPRPGPKLDPLPSTPESPKPQVEQDEAPKRQLLVAVSILLDKGNKDFAFRYFKGQTDVLAPFIEACTRETQLTISSNHEVKVSVSVGKEDHRIGADAELLEWMAMSREADRPLRVRLSVRLIPQPQKSKSPSAAASTHTTDSAYSTPSASKDKSFLTPVAPPKATTTALQSSKNGSFGSLKGSQEIQEAVTSVPAAGPPEAAKNNMASSSTSSSVRRTVASPDGKGLGGLVCVASSKFGKLLQSYVFWEGREALVMCRLRSGSLIADFKRAICFEFGAPPKTESSTLFLSYKMWSPENNVVKDGEVHNDVQLGALASKCEVRHLTWQVQSKLGGAEGMTGVFEFEVGMLAAELIVHLGDAFKVSDLQNLLGPSNKYFKEKQRKFFVHLEAMPEAMIRVTVKDLESLLQRCFKEMDTADARMVSSTCLAKLKICLTRKDALQRFFAVIYRSMRKPNGQVPLAVLEEIFEHNNETLSETLRGAFADHAALSEEELSSTLMQRYETEQTKLLNCLSMAAMEGIIRQSNFFEYPIHETGRRAVQAQYQEHLERAVKNFTATDLERFCRDVQGTPNSAFEVVLSIVGALLAPADTTNYISYMMEHCKGKVTQVLHARMRSFKQTEPPLPLPLVYQVVWTLLRPPLDPGTLAHISSVGAALVEWAFMAIQLECVARDNTFPVMPPYNGLPAELVPISCEMEGQLCFANSECQASPSESILKKAKAQYKYTFRTN